MITYSLHFSYSHKIKINKNQRNKLSYLKLIIYRASNCSRATLSYSIVSCFSYFFTSQEKKNLHSVIHYFKSFINLEFISETDDCLLILCYLFTPKIKIKKEKERVLAQEL